MLDLGPDDVGYVAMPLFHSNALMVGWAPVDGDRRFGRPGATLQRVRASSATCAATAPPGSTTPASRSRTCSDLRHSPTMPTTRCACAFGNEGSPAVLDEFARRFDLEVIDAFGSTEGAIALNRDGPGRPGAMGLAGPSIKIIDDAGEECPLAELDDAGHLTNADACVGEIVNTDWRRALRGLLQQRRGDREGDAQRVVLVRRPRVPRRGSVPVLRRSDR